MPQQKRKTGAQAAHGKLEAIERLWQQAAARQENENENAAEIVEKSLSPAMRRIDMLFREAEQFAPAPATPPAPMPADKTPGAETVAENDDGFENVKSRFMATAALKPRETPATPHPPDNGDRGVQAKNTGETAGTGIDAAFTAVVADMTRNYIRDELGGVIAKVIAEELAMRRGTGTEPKRE